MAELSERLAAFLLAERHRGFDWAARPCVMLPNDWLVHLGLPDASAEWRGRWTDETSGMALLASVGGVAGLMAISAARLGLPPSHAVRTGDIGAVVLPGGRAVGAIRTDCGWAARSPRGLWRGRAELTTGWRVEV